MIDSIIDLHGERQMAEDMATVKAAGVLGMIHRAATGLLDDDKYIARRDAALAQGILWGAYLYITEHDDPIAQADHFVDLVQPTAKTLIAVDVERSTAGTIPTLAQVEACVVRIHERTGRWPMLYTGFFVLKDEYGWNASKAQASPLRNCLLWLAAYNENPVIPPGWSDCTLHQYTDGTLGPEPIRFPGLQNSYDRERYNGSFQQLVAWWGS